MTQFPMTSDLWNFLAKLAQADIWFDLRDRNGPGGESFCQDLKGRGYAKSINTGPGDSITRYSITPAGEAALAEYNASAEE